MRVVPLASGSKGNATLVEMCRPGYLFGPTRLLVDAGLSGRELTRRLRSVDVDPRSISALLLSHEHEDHVRGAERFSRVHHVPVFSSRATLDAMDRSPCHFHAWHPLAARGALDIDGIRMEAFPVPHDAVEPVGFVLTGHGERFGIVTDLGHATPAVVDRLRGCDVLMVESNHDDRMLLEGPYPWHLKRRVSGRFGHLSNEEAASLLRQAVVGECRAVVLCHLSEKNNTRELATRSATAAVRKGSGGGPAVHVAESGVPSRPIDA